VQQSISNASWLADETTRSLVAALETGARAPEMRFVGGCVRNTLLGLAAGDIDISTVHPPQRVMALAERAGLKAVPTGIEHGTVTVIAHGKPFEVTTLRRDVKAHGRHADVQFTDDWEGDARRRDFTMNAIYADASGALYDPVGGRADLAARRVKFIGDARARIAEDYLRILRFFRFHAWYGRGPLDEAGLAACVAERAGLQQLSAERVQKELLQLLGAREPIDTLRTMSESGILASVLPEGRNFDALAALCVVEADYLFVADSVRRLAVFIEADETGAAALAARLRLSNAAAERLLRLRKIANPLPPGEGRVRGGEARPAGEITLSPEIEGATLRVLLYHEGIEAVVDRMILSWAARGPEVDVDLWEALLEIVRAYKRPKFPLTGHDVMALGASGARVGEILAAVEAWWIAKDFMSTRDALLARAREVASG
jgi:poly(A) polymerase